MPEVIDAALKNDGIVERAEHWVSSSAKEAWAHPGAHLAGLAATAFMVGAAVVTRGEAIPACESGIKAQVALADAEMTTAAQLCASQSLAVESGVLSTFRRMAVQARDASLSHVPTPGAFIRKWSVEDQAACDAVAKATNMGRYNAGGEAWVLEAPKSGVVGYTSIANRCWADIAVLPKYRGDTRLLADMALKEMREQGGKWYTNARESTGYPFMKRLESSGAIEIEGDQRLYGRDPNHGMDFTVL